MGVAVRSWPVLGPRDDRRACCSSGVWPEETLQAVPKVKSSVPSVAPHTAVLPGTGCELAAAPCSAWGLTEPEERQRGPRPGVGPHREQNVLLRLAASLCSRLSASGAWVAVAFRNILIGAQYATLGHVCALPGAQLLLRPLSQTGQLDWVHVLNRP